MIGKLDQHFRYNESVLSLRSERQRVLASNIANADTPNYKARDFNFSEALSSAMSGPGPAALARTAPRHLQAQDVGPGGAPLLYRPEVQGAVDGNTVDMDVERTQFADNALRYEAAVTFVNSQIRGMLTAITGGQ
ncbi:flagellar basal body rod protein FlgB [Massilia sp. W12]|uniref:flagellar basal body rod protein FlgB n=1 Tax=Massilia sp. W12 TaxID=3126507 RepID=UPI0030D27216